MTEVEDRRILGKKTGWKGMNHTPKKLVSRFLSPVAFDLYI